MKKPIGDGLENDWILSSSTKLVSAKYSKQGFTHGILACGYHQIGKLRGDANLRYLYTGEQKAKGRRKSYDGKMVVGDISRLVFIGEQTVYRAL